MLKKKLWVLLPIVALSAFILTACSSSKADSSKTSTVTSELINKNELTIGLEGTYAPFSYRKDGKLQGFEVDLGKALAKKVGVKAKFVPTQWDSLEVKSSTSCSITSVKHPSVRKFTTSPHRTCTPDML